MYKVSEDPHRISLRRAARLLRLPPRGGRLKEQEAVPHGFPSLSGNKPAVVIYDTDGRVGKYEHRIKVACARMNSTDCTNMPDEPQQGS